MFQTGLRFLMILTMENLIKKEDEIPFEVPEDWC